MRCCSGESYVVPGGPAHQTVTFDRDPRRARGLARPTERDAAPSWAVCCSDCHTVLAVVDCPREEVYAAL